MESWNGGPCASSGKLFLCGSIRANRQGDEAYYPVNNARHNEIYAKYAEEAARTPNLILGGRLGAYRYWDMDKAIADALNVFETRIRPAGV